MVVVLNSWFWHKFTTITIYLTDQIWWTCNVFWHFFLLTFPQKKSKTNRKSKSIEKFEKKSGIFFFGPAIVSGLQSFLATEICPKTRILLVIPYISVVHMKCFENEVFWKKMKCFGNQNIAPGNPPTHRRVGGLPGAITPSFWILDHPLMKKWIQ